MDDLEILNQRNRRPEYNDFISVQDAVIEEISVSDRTRFVTISYGVLGNAGMIFMEVVKLIVSEDTVILDEMGNRIPFRNLQEGMRVDAWFSTIMTRSIPPQSNAFRIIVNPEETFTNVTVDRIVRVDERNGFLYTGNARDINEQMRFVVTDATVILNRRGNQISLERLGPGQLVEVVHANFQTASIPPQTTAFRIQVL